MAERSPTLPHALVHSALALSVSSFYAVALVGWAASHGVTIQPHWAPLELAARLEPLAPGREEDLRRAICLLELILYSHHEVGDGEIRELGARVGAVAGEGAWSGAWVYWRRAIIQRRQS